MEGSKGGSRRPQQPGLAAAYTVVLRSQNQPDDVIASLLKDVRRLTTDALTRAAMRRFGPAYLCQLGAATPDASVRMAVLLLVRYPVRATAGALDEFRRFAGEIELAIADALA